MSQTAADPTLLTALEWLAPLQHHAVAANTLSPQAREFLARSFPENTRVTYRRILLDFRS